MIRIEVDEKSGFCSGVIKAVKAAEKHLEDTESLCSLGELVHNPQEVERLRARGLKPVSYEQFNDLKNIPVLIRAHGEPPETFDMARERNIRLIDATCSIVKKIQQQIRDCYVDLKGKEGSILIFGKSSHPEVRALVGQTDGTAIVMRDPGELPRQELQSPIFLFSQTTMNTEEYGRFRESLKKRMGELGMDPGHDLHVHDTICRQVSSRESILKAFVRPYDLVLFVSGKESSNGKALYKICRDINKNTYFISHPEESDNFPLEGITSIGICGATSTPGWLLQAVKMRLEQRININGT